MYLLRYPSINMKAVTANKAKQFYDDVQDDYYEDVVSPAKKIKRSKWHGICNFFQLQIIFHR